VVGKLQQEIGAHRLFPRMRARKTRFSLFNDDIETSLKQQCSSVTLDRDSPLVKIRRLSLSLSRRSRLCRSSCRLSAYLSLSREIYLHLPRLSSRLIRLRTMTIDSFHRSFPLFVLSIVRARMLLTRARAPLLSAIGCVSVRSFPFLIYSPKSNKR